MIDDLKFYAVTCLYGAGVIAATLIIAYAGFSEAVSFALK